MAKHPQPRSSGPSRIRFIMVDAEISDGNISEVTQAIAAALRPTMGNGTAPRAIVQVPRAPSNDHTDEQPAEEELAPEQANTEQPESATRPAKRSLRTPKVLELDLVTEPSFVTFAEAKKPPSDAMRYLVIAYWFKHHRDAPAITADHVYTCYRAVKWSSSIPDFAATLRGLKHRGLMSQPERGKYAINHLGEAEVDKLGTAGA